jgi:hypothetical protein
VGSAASASTVAAPTSSPSTLWLLLAYQLPSRRSNARVATWRRLQRVGAVRLVLRDTAALMLADMALGAVLAIALARSLATLLYGVGSPDPLTWTVGPLALVTVALTAAFPPARRASRADPLARLRENP